MKCTTIRFSKELCSVELDGLAEEMGEDQGIVTRKYSQVT
jgi:hypothetical protein